MRLSTGTVLPRVAGLLCIALGVHTTVWAAVWPHSDLYYLYYWAARSAGFAGLAGGVVTVAFVTRVRSGWQPIAALAVAVPVLAFVAAAAFTATGASTR